MRSAAQEISRAAADEVNNFKAVALGDAGICPLSARNNAAVMLDGYPITFETEVNNQILEVGPGRKSRKFTRLAIEDEVHGGRVSPPPCPLSVRHSRP